MEPVNNQLILTIEREFGSGGREIADIIGKRLNIPVFEKNILENLGLPDHKDVEDLYYRDEAPRWKLTSRTVRGLTNSNEAALAAMEFDFLQKLADQGKSFIIIGHCSDEVLKDYDCMSSFFVSATTEFKIPRIMAEHHVEREEALQKMKRHDYKRKTYHNSYCEHKWGDSRYFDLCLHSDTIGTQKSADLILDYISQKYPKLDVTTLTPAEVADSKK